MSFLSWILGRETDEGPLHPHLEQIQKQLAELDVVAERTGDSELIVRAHHEAVGDIVILAKDSEIIVSIGEQFHQHFSRHGDSTIGGDDVGQFVSDFVSDRIVLTVKFSDSRPTQARTSHSETGESFVVVFPTTERASSLDSQSTGPRESIHSFRWTGPVEVASPGPDDDGDADLAGTISQLSPNEMRELADYLIGQVKKPGGEE